MTSHAILDCTLIRTRVKTTATSDYAEELPIFAVGDTKQGVTITLLILNTKTVFPAQAEYSYFSADFRLKVFSRTEFLDYSV